MLSVHFLDDNIYMCSHLNTIQCWQLIGRQTDRFNQLLVPLQSTLGVWFPLPGHYQMASPDDRSSPNLLLKRSGLARGRIMSLAFLSPLLETIANVIKCRFPPQRAQQGVRTTAGGSNPARTAEASCTGAHAVYSSAPLPVECNPHMQSNADIHLKPFF